MSILDAFDLAEAFLAIALFGYGYGYGRSRQKSKVRSGLYGLVNVLAVALVVWLKLSTHH